MAIDVRLLDTRSRVPARIAPVRFARAVELFAQADAPDLDDHGFTLAPYPCKSRGPTVGTSRGKIIKVKVVRDRISKDAPLYVTSDDETIAKVVFPEKDTPLDPEDRGGERYPDCVYIEGMSFASLETIIKVRYGSSTGPVLAELGVRVYHLLKVRVKAHAVAIDGVGPVATIATVRDVFRMVNHIYAPAGVEFEVVGGMQAEAVSRFFRPGTVVLYKETNGPEVIKVVSQRPHRQMLNAFFVRHSFSDEKVDHLHGQGFTRIDGDPSRPVGFWMRDRSDELAAAVTTAHEIGHVLGLQHYNFGNEEKGEVGDVRHDIWAHRNLMHNYSNLTPASKPEARYKSSAARVQIGYGGNSQGQLLTIKDRPGIQQSDQVNQLRKAILEDRYKPR
jgi:hypothetical protein